MSKAQTPCATTNATRALSEASQTFRHAQALFQAIEYAYATGGETKLDIMSLAEIGLHISGEAGETASDWAAMLDKELVK